MTKKELIKNLQESIKEAEKDLQNYGFSYDEFLKMDSNEDSCGGYISGLKEALLLIKQL